MPEILTLPWYVCTVAAGIPRFGFRQESRNLVGSARLILAGDFGAAERRLDAVVRDCSASQRSLEAAAAQLLIAATRHDLSERMPQFRHCHMSLDLLPEPERHSGALLLRIVADLETARMLDDDMSAELLMPRLSEARARGLTDVVDALRRRLDVRSGPPRRQGDTGGTVRP